MDLTKISFATRRFDIRSCKLSDADTLSSLMTAYSVEKLLLIWVLAAGSIILLILEFARDDGTTSGSTICSFLRLFD